MRIPGLVLLTILLVAASTDPWPETRQAAELAETAKDHAKAEELWRKAIAESGDDAARQRTSLAGLGRVLLAAGKPAAAVDPLKKAGRLFRADESAPAAERLGNCRHLAEAYSLGGDFNRASFALREALTLVVSVEGKDSTAEAWFRFRLGCCLSPYGKTDEAIACHRRALAIYIARTGRDSDEVRDVLEHLVRLLSSPGNWKAVLPHARHYHKLVAGAEKPDPACLDKSRFLLARALLECDRPREAEYHYRVFLRGSRGSEAWAWVGIGRVRFSQGRLGEAEMYVRKGMSVGAGPLTGAPWLLADIIERRGRKADAEKIRKKAAAVWRQES